MLRYPLEFQYTDGSIVKRGDSRMGRNTKYCLIVLLVHLIGFACGAEDYDYYRQGYIDYKIGKYQEAERNYQKAIALNAKESKYHSWLAHALLKQNKVSLAKKEISLALKLNPNENEATLLISELVEKPQVHIVRTAKVSRITASMNASSSLPKASTEGVHSNFFIAPPSGYDGLVR